MAWRDMKPQTKILTVLVLIMILFIGLFITGILQQSLSDIGRKRIEVITKKYEDQYELDIKEDRANSEEVYRDYVDELNEKNAGGFLLLSSWMYTICLQGQNAADLKLEFFYYHGITHPESAFAWYKLMKWEADQDNGKEVTIAMGNAFFHLFNNQYMVLTEGDEPHPRFEKLRPRVIKLMKSKFALVSIPNKEDDDILYEFGDSTANYSKAHEMQKGVMFLKLRHKKFIEWELHKWFSTSENAW